MMRWRRSRPDRAARASRRDLLKKFLLASAALGLAVLAFVVYSSQFATPQTVTVRPRPATRPSTTGPASGMEVGTLALGGGGQGAQIGPGDKTKIQVFDDYGRLKAEFRSQRWEPVAEDEFKLTRPEVWVFTPSGQVTHIVADDGQVVVEQVGRGNLNPKWGWLRGNVRIFIDRTTNAWRERNSSYARPEQHPESVIQIWLDEVRFDVDLAQLTSDGPIQVQSHEADIQGHGLVMHWNQLDDRIALLEIREGKRMLLRRTGLVNFALPGSEREVSPPAESATTAMTALPTPSGSTESPATQPQVTGNRPAAVANLPERGGVPEVATTAPASSPDRRAEGRQKRVDTYEAVFEGDVVIVQREQDRLAGELRADKLELLFDFGARERSAIATEPTTQPSEEPEKGKPAEGYVELTWTGKMVMKPVEPATTQPQASENRFHVVATGTGSPVYLADGQNTAECSELEYRNETEQVWLRGTADQPVKLSSGEHRQLCGGRVFFDRREGKGRVEGPGWMIDRASRDGSRKPSEVRWSQGAELVMGRVFVPRVDGLGRAALGERSFVEQATFRGNVGMTREDQQVTADEVVVFFDPPGDRRAVAETARSVKADGNVILARGQERISCDGLLLELTVDREGKNVPQLARAVGQVIARQGRRVIRADKAIARFEPTDTSERRELIADKRSSYRISMLEADGRVTVRDPRQRVDVVADELECTFARDDRGVDRIDHAVVVGEPEAQVAFEDYLVVGRRIELDMPLERAEVNGTGRLEFLTRQDLDGRHLVEPVPVTIHWKERMTLRGADNVALFEGQVRSVSRTNVLTCQTLRVDFQETPKHLAGADQAGPDYWIFESFVRRGLGRDTDRTALARRSSKRPAYVVAQGDVVALSSELDRSGKHRLSSMRMAGPKMVVDLLQDQVDVLGSGSLLLEDYRPPRAQPIGKSTPIGPLMGNLGGQGPSQTAVTWGQSMTLFWQEDTAIFFGGVHMVHRAGKELALAENVAEALQVDVRKLPLLEGRRVTLTCQQLVVQFARSGQTRGDLSAMNQARSTDLRRIEASGNIHLQDGPFSVMGGRLTYDRISELVTVRGTGDLEARILEQDDRTGRLRLFRGPELRWYRGANRIEAPRAHVWATP
ncbi:MAG TPA: hypothetical protein VMZ31_15615 [Phycisphaerae bacterium]|nr:hypothetical protein [Phycisphaerae bacterium]